MKIEVQLASTFNATVTHCKFEDATNLEVLHIISRFIKLDGLDISLITLGITESELKFRIDVTIDEFEEYFNDAIETVLLNGLINDETIQVRYDNEEVPKLVICTGADYIDKVIDLLSSVEKVGE